MDRVLVLLGTFLAVVQFKQARLAGIQSRFTRALEQRFHLFSSFLEKVVLVDAEAMP